MYSIEGDDEHVIKAFPCSNAMRKSSQSFAVEKEALELFAARLGDLVRSKALPRLEACMTRDTQPIALKLGPRGVDLLRYLRLTNLTCDYAALSAVARKVGVALVRTLQRVHETGIAHGDIRIPNVILVPSDKTLLRALNARLVHMDEGTLMRDIVIDSCEVLLNDWGTAVQLDARNRADKTSKDLMMVVGVTCNLDSIMDAASTSRSESRGYPPTPSDNKRAGATIDKRNDGLLKAAKQRNYRKMIALFEDFSYTYT